MREVRLVIDTGIHADGWSREQAVAYFRQSGSADEPMIQAEVDRYIAWPVQALSYKIGQLEILKLRQRSQRELGSSRNSVRVLTFVNSAMKFCVLEPCR